jgi:hypothetical protein
MGKKANPRTLDFAKKWREEKLRGEGEEEYPSATTWSSEPKLGGGEQRAQP